MRLGLVGRRPAWRQGSCTWGRSGSASPRLCRSLRSSEFSAWPENGRYLDARAYTPDAEMLNSRGPTDIEEPRLVERDREIAQIASAVDQARAGDGRILVIEAPPGVGKTSLLQELRSSASKANLQLLSARGGQLETGFAYGVVRQLFEPALMRMRRDNQALELDGPSAWAVAALKMVPTDGEPVSLAGAFDDTLHLLHGLYWLVSDLAERGPLLISVDDAHWADPSSLSFFEYLAHRLEGVGVLVALALRPPDADAELGALQRLAAEPETILIRPQPLSEEGTARVVRSLLSADADDGFCRACHEATRGNPFLLRELALTLRSEGFSAKDEESSRVARLAPESVARAVLVRLAALPHAARKLAQAVMTFGGMVQLRHAADLAGLSLHDAAEAADRLVSADILAPGRPLAFVHPMVRESIARESAAATRAVAHAQAARILHDAGEPPDHVAPHLLACEPKSESWRVDVLRRAAQTALERGSPATSVGMLRRALEEPPPEEIRMDVLVELGHAEARAGDPAAPATLQEAAKLAEGTVRRAEILLALAKVRNFFGDFETALDLLDEAKAEISPEQRELALRLEGESLGAARLDPRTREAARARLKRIASETPAGSASGALMLANLALDELESGAPASRVRELAQRALAGRWLLAEESFVFSYAANALTWTDHLDEAGDVWDEALEEAEQRGSPGLFALVYTWRSHLAYRRGNVLAAEVDAQSSLEVIHEFGMWIALGYAAAFLADVLIERGDLEGAAASVEIGDNPVPPFLLDTRARLAYDQSRFEESLQNAMDCAEMLRARGGRDSPGIISWRSRAALACAALGDQAEARRLINEEVDLARDQGILRALSAALRTAGLIEGGTRGLALLEEAVAVLEDSPARLERARSLIELGAAIRRSGQASAARDPLRAGLDLAHNSRATTLVDRARKELLAAGARPRKLVFTGIDALTTSERRVAELAAQGKSNREIAQALFVSMSTVARHLTHSYQKLGIKARDELPTSFAQTASAVDEDPAD